VIWEQRLLGGLLPQSSLHVLLSPRQRSGSDGLARREYVCVWAGGGRVTLEQWKCSFSALSLSLPICKMWEGGLATTSWVSGEGQEADP
jgi:hypothetical protein